ncbi:MAG: GFA family protein [Myxococcota bacterium]
MTHEATCACGHLRVHVEGDLPGTSICHCRQCQKRTGSAFGVQVKIPNERVRIEGTFKVFERRGEGVVTLHFCPECGSTVYWRLDGMPDVVVIAAGAFAGSTVPPPPVFSVYEDRMHPWVHLPDSVETHWD